MDFDDNYPSMDWIQPLVTTKAPMPIVRHCAGLLCAWQKEEQPTLPPLQVGVYRPFEEVTLVAEADTTGGLCVNFGAFV